jgi:hypothetical protein
MKHTVIRAAITAALLTLGWVAGLARSRGDFELLIDASSGTTIVECVRGCTLVGGQDIENPRAGRMHSYEFACDPPTGRCRGRAVGFIEPLKDDRQ